MMNMPMLPMGPGAMPAGFATFLANIGQVPADGGESVGFDQLLAATPMVPAAPVKAELALPVHASAPVADNPSVATDAAAETPAAKAETPEARPAAVLAANLLVALNGGAPDGPATGKPARPETGVDAGADMADAHEIPATTPATNETPVAVETAPVLTVPLLTAPTTAATKPAQPVDASPAPADDGAPAISVAARPRDAATPMAVPTGGEPAAAKPAEAAPSMTILLTPSTAPGAAMLADASAPMQIAERVLDIDSDGAWIDQLARDIAATKSESGDISFRLMPRHLGRLDVAMRMGDEGMLLKMDTHHEATATIVTAAQPRLVEDLRQQGVRVTGTEVTCTPGETGRQSQGQGQGQARAAAHDAAHLIETATERAESRDEDRAADRRGRFA